MQVEFFVQRYQNLLPSTLNELEEEFLNYQLMRKCAIKIDADEKKTYRMDVIWWM